MQDEYSQLRLWIVLMLAVLAPLQSFSLAADVCTEELELTVDRIMQVADEEVKLRLQSLDHDLVEYRFDPAVRSIIRRYLMNHRSNSTIILGRATVFLPIFEEHLRATGLPEALKYLPIVESALRPDAVSRVGAMGLWQFMPPTAREMGLRVDEYVDERIDPNKATAAALAYLRRQHNHFGDWALALAAYNAGKGNVMRAMRRSRRSTFWTIRRYLPRETANYVPTFIAATYLAEFFVHHNLEPALPELDRQLTESMLLYRPCSFYRIAQVTGLDIEEIEALNPGYKKGYLPGYTTGHYLILPKRVMPAWKTYLELYPAEDDEPFLPVASVFLPYKQEDEGIAAYRTGWCQTQEGQRLSEVATDLGCSVYQLAAWNSFSPADTLCAGQELRYYEPAVFRHFTLPLPPLKEVARLSIRPLRSVRQLSPEDLYCLPVQYKSAAHSLTVAAQLTAQGFRPGRWIRMLRSNMAVRNGQSTVLR